MIDVRKKLALVLICIMLLCINNLAAVVSDNDGSAFITKAEYDSLKNDFQAQLDKYNTTIDTKIDVAIASYLKGIDVAATRTFDVINANWKEVTFINGSYANDYVVPDIYYLLAAGGYYQGDVTFGGVRDWSSHAYLYYKRTDGTANRKNCFNVLSGTEGSPIAIQWKGIARGYRESILYASENNANYVSLGGWNWPTYDKRVLVENALKPKSASYSINADSAITDISFKCQFKQNTSSTWENAAKASDIFVKTMTDLSIGLDRVGDKEYDTEHIVGWDRDTNWELYCPDWNHSWQLSSNQTLTETNVFNALTQSTTGWYEGLERTGDSSVLSHVGSMPFQFTNGTNKFYSVGLYAIPVKNREIYQMSENILYKSTGTFTVYNSTLEAGLPILAASKDDEVTYTPTIYEVQCYDESGNLVTNANELEIYFSYGPFYEKNSTADPVEVEIGELTYEGIVTSDRKANVKFKMKKDSVVYMQIKPHFSSGATIGPSKNWYITFNLTGDNITYKVKVNKKS